MTESIRRHRRLSRSTLSVMSNSGGVCRVNDEFCVDGGKVRCRDLCRKHYQRMLRTGGIAKVEYHVRPRKAKEGEGWCAKCEQFKPAESFGIDRNRKSGIKVTCRECEARIRKSNYDPERDWAKRLRREYSLSPRQYYEMLDAQGSVCAICGTAEATRAPKNQKLHVDHCHETGKIRGLLCFRCNSTLGRVEDSTDILSALAEYLKGSKND